MYRVLLIFLVSIQCSLYGMSTHAQIAKTFRVVFFPQAQSSSAYYKDFNSGGGDVLSFIRTVDPTIKSINELKVHAWTPSSKDHTWCHVTSSRCEKLPFFVTKYSAANKHLQVKIHLARK